MRTNICLAIMAIFAFSPFAGLNAQYSLTVESAPAVGAGGTVYRFYVNANDATDKMSAVFGNNEANLVITTPDGIFNSPFNASWNASGINPAFLVAFPDMADDSYATIGLEGPASTSGIAGAADPSIVEDTSLSPTVSGYFGTGGTELNVNTLTGASWYVLNTAANALPVDGRWLVAQVTTTGSISGQINFQVFPLGVGADQVQISMPFDGVGTFGDDGGNDVPGCMDSTACNYNADATVDDGSCSFIADGECDCDGNVVDALGECGGSCAADADGDGVCDDVDDCVGDLDACGICNGPGAIYDCGCSDIPEGDCDCDGGQLDALGVCGGSCEADADGDGVCDDVDDCLGQVDACGVCDGDGSSCTGCMDPDASNYDENNLFEDNGQCLYATTFNVDMSCASNAGAMLNGSSSFLEVFVTGPIFGWAANDGYNQLTDADGDGIYSVTLDFPAGDIEYKYAIDGFADQEQLVDDVQAGGTCAPITDGAGYANRLVAAGSSTSDTYGSCTTCADQAEPVNVTFQVDMNQYSEAYAYGGVFLNGSFTGWCGACAPMDDSDGDGIWTITVPLMPGTVEYKFTLDGWNYQEEFAGGESCTSTIDGFTNRTLDVTEDVVLAAVCWESCDVCPDIDDVLGCMDSSANNYNADATVEPENSCLYDVTLSVDASQTDFTSMSLAGTFNGWNNGSNFMDDSDGDGTYTITVSMTAGAQEYKFLGNGDWAFAEAFDGTETCTTDPGEYVNRVILVEGPTTGDTVCYNSCEACLDAVLGCTDATACNYNADADTDDGSCDYCSCGGSEEAVAYPLVVEASTPSSVAGTTYRFYVQMQDESDRMSAVFGNNEAHLLLNSPSGIYNSSLNASWNASGINPAFLAVFPELADDSYATIGLTGPAASSGIAGAADPSLVEDTSLSPSVSGYFLTGGTELSVTTLTGASWYILNTAANGLPDADGRVLVMQITSEGPISGQLNYQVFPLGVGQDQVQISLEFDGAGTFGAGGGNACGCTDSAATNYDSGAQYDDGSCEYDAAGCTDESACNYDANATADDGSCVYIDAGACDCDGNVLDALGVCGGDCTADSDDDGICDDADNCVGELDACGVCNGDGSSCTGCMDPAASNYDENNLFEDNGQCLYATTFNVDMSCATNAGAMLNGSAGFSEVFVTGPIFGWAANDGYNQLTDADGDGIYSVTLDFPAGDIEYKYAIDGFADQEQLVDDVQAGGTCAPITDGAGYANRLVAAGSSTSDTYGSCTTCADQAEPANVTFQVDMNQYSEPYAYGGVFLNGSFTGWCGACAPMDDSDGDGIWTITVPLMPGTVEYKFTLDGWNYQEEFAGGESCTSTIDGFTNRTLDVTEDVVLAAVCWESCDVCPDIDDVLGCMDSSANNYNADATVEPENSCLYDVTLSVDASQTDFTSMSLAGTFNGWNNGSNFMDDSDGDGTYTITVSMTAGAQEYKFLGNGDWAFAEAFDGTETCTTDPGEYVNRVILVEGPTTGDTVCYNSCEACVDPVFGCTDETACNYNPDATDNVTGSTGVLVDLTAGSWPSEIFWSLNGESYGAPFNGEIALEPGTYTIEAGDTYGDGWNGAVMTVTDLGSGESVTYSLDSGSSGSFDIVVTALEGACTYAPDYYECDGETCLNDTDGDGVCDELEIEGCVVPTACNYNPNATDLVPCQYPEPGYLCDGSCDGDADGDGVCDANEIEGCQDASACNYDETATDAGECDFDSCLGCTDELACNYDASATQDDGSCDFCSCSAEGEGGQNGFGLTVETHAEDGIAGLTTYRVYLTTPNASDFVSAVAGDQINPSYLRTSTSFYQNALGGLTADAINPLFFGSFPDLEYDSWLTIGIDSAPTPGDGTAAVTLAQAGGDTWAADFEAGQNLELNSFFGGSWFTTNLSSNGVAGDDKKVLLAQLTTDGSLSGQLYVQVFPLGVGADAEYLTLSFESFSCGCTDESACNYDANAQYDDGSCELPGPYDCDGETCLNDTDGDGVCDELEIEGCVVPTACNYDPNATDLVPCVYPDPGYLCDGTCDGDADGDGVCDANEIVGCQDSAACNYDAAATDAGSCEYESCLGCTDATACNYDETATQNDGSCDYCSCADEAQGGQNGFGLAVETHAENGIFGLTTYRIYVTTPNANDFVSAIAGDEINPSFLRTSSSFYQNALGGLTADAINPLFFGSFPELEFDSWLTIGIDSAPTPGDGTAAVTLAQAAGDTWAADFEAGQNLELNSFFGGSWFTTNLSSNGVAGDDKKVLVAQLTTDGSLTGQLYVQVFPQGVGADAEYLTLTFGSSSCGCTDESACNYNDSASYDDGSCLYADEYNECDGTCLIDLDEDGICDNVDECIGAYDACGVCNGPGEIYECGCTDIPAEDCDCDGNQLDILGVCGGGCEADINDNGLCDATEITGCTDPEALNYYAGATFDDGSCIPNIPGCTNAVACNYNPDATVGNGTCEYASCSGCLIEEACNYDPEASIEANETCTFPATIYVDCDGVCFNDADGDGVCDEAEILGCTDPQALNYNPNATEDNGNCIANIPGCLNPIACNYDPAATVGNGSCEYLTCAGCTDEAACNYDADATIEDNGSCDYPATSYVDCDGACLNDMDGDGICDELEVAGCTDDDALNYDADATDDDGSCIATVLGCLNPSACNYDANANVSDGSCEFESCVGCTLTDACNYDADATIAANGTCEYPSESYLDCDGNCLNDEDGNGVCDELDVTGCMDPTAFNYNPNATQDNGSCVPVILGCVQASACNYDANANTSNGTCEFSSCAGCLNEAACNYDATATIQDNSTCEYPAESNLNCDGSCINDADGDGVCDEDEILGCTNPDAQNFNANATEDNGNCVVLTGGCLVPVACNYDPAADFDYNDPSQCEFDSCTGCTVPVACNYDPTATLPANTTCVFPEQFYDCDGNCNVDSDGDGICNQLEIPGCTDETAVNYNPNATNSTNNCIYVISGCTLPFACNYDPNAEVYEEGACDFDCAPPIVVFEDCTDELACNFGEAGPCVYFDENGDLCATFGCMDVTACNYDDTAQVADDSCEYLSCQGCTDSTACNYDATATTDNGTCESESCAGCTDADAINYDETATIDDGTCILPGCTIVDACNYDANAGQNDGSCEYLSCAGCTLEAACNYDATATISNNSLCTYPAEAYLDCAGDCLNDADGDGICDEIEVAGCTDETAFNYDADATDDDGSCIATVAGCLNLTACNYNAAANVSDGSCEFDSCAGCTLEAACNYDATATIDNNTTCTYPAEDYLDCDGNCLNDADGDGICDELEVAGCTDDTALNYDADATDDDESCIATVLGCLNPGACNYNAAANVSDGSCEFDSCAGCMLADACNYDADATIAINSTCTYPAEDYLDCDGNCLNDADADGICDELEVAGCTDETAFNYDADATDDDGSCVDVVTGCLNDSACNYNAEANTSDGSCDFDSCVGCMIETACNYSADYTVAANGTCTYPAEDYLDCDGNCLNDADADGICDELEVAGCTDETAFNYDADATDDDSSCEAVVEGCLQASACNYDANANTSNGSCDFDSCVGCMIETACNYSPDYTIAANGTCTYPTQSYFDCDGNCLNDSDGDGICDEVDDCFGTYDSCGVCAGPGEIYECGCADIPEGDCDCDGNQLDVVGVCGGTCTEDADADGICDDVDDCVGEYDSCGVCNGPGEIYECGCADIPEGDCDCDGNQLDALGVCGGTCEGDDDGDGICNDAEIVGCQEEDACNYDPTATDAGDCEYVDPTVLPGDGPACGLFFSGYAEGSSNNKFMEIYNPTSEAISLDGYAFPNVSNAPSVPGEYEFWNTFTPGATIAAGDVYVIAHGSADPAILAEADQTFTYLSNGDDGFMLVMGTETDFIQIDAIGDWNGDPGSGWDVAGVSAGTQNHSLIRKSDVTSGNGGDWTASAGTDADDSEWIVLDIDDWTGLGSHEFTGSCDGGGSAVVYDCDGVCLNDADGDGVCDELEIGGCTDSGACNYEFTATDEDGSCEYVTCAGCTDDTGCNYDATATIEDGSCTYPDAFYDCAGNCLNDLNLNGICDELEVLGCTYEAACNYDSDANVDDGQCDFSCLLTGCTDPAADNYDAAATVDNGNCFYVGCMDTNALNYDSGANFPGNCEYCEGDFNYDGEVDVNDLLDFFQLWGNVCE